MFTCDITPSLLPFVSPDYAKLEKRGGGKGAKHQNFPIATFLPKKILDEVREIVPRDKPKKNVFASYDIAKECVFNVLEL